jgi:hypothetical protein
METGHDGYRVLDQRNQVVKEVDAKTVIDGRDTSSPNIGMDALHINDFLSAIKNNRRPNADVAELHKSTTLVQLGNIAWRTGQRLTCDPSSGRILNSPEAQALWQRTYEPGWELIV